MGLVLRWGLTPEVLLTLWLRLGLGLGWTLLLGQSLRWRLAL